MNVNFLLFNDFETLDAFGPVEILAQDEAHQLHFYSLSGGLISSSQGVKVWTQPSVNMTTGGILVVPGGLGTRSLVHDELFIFALKGFAQDADYCLSICTGSALLAKAGVLDGFRATSNKKAFEWAVSVSDGPIWVRKARWIVDGKFYTSSGVSAGMDMALGFMADVYGREKAEAIARDIEYCWNSHPEDDPF